MKKIIFEVEVLKVNNLDMKGDLAKDKMVLASIEKLAKRYAKQVDNYFKKCRMKTKTTFTIE